MKVFCEVCKKPVDAFGTWTDPHRDNTIVVAQCHGASDEIHLSALDSIRSVHAHEEISAFQAPAAQEVAP